MIVAAMFANALLMLALPVAVALGVRRATGARWALFAGGAAAFVGSQIVHLPLLWAWSGLTQAGLLPPLGRIGDAIVLGALAALCEEPARALLFGRVFPRDRGRDAALLAGAGHGGIEAAIFGALALLGAINLAASRDLDAAQLEAAGVAPAQAAAAVAQIREALAAPWYDALAGAFERAITIPFHVSCSLLVVAALRRRSALPFVAAVAAHAVLDAVGVLVASSGQSTWAVELELAALVVPWSALVIAWALRAEPRAAGPQ